MIKVKHKKAFSMVTAIFVIIIMATVSSLIMNVTGKTVKETTQQYQKEQAQLLARSYTELAISKVLNTDRTITIPNPNPCVEQINDHFGAAGSDGYDINITIKYIGNDTLLANCRNNIEANGGFNLTNKNATWSNNSGGFYNTLSMVVDTYISYKDFDDPENRDITFHRRTLQKL